MKRVVFVLVLIAWLCLSVIPVDARTSNYIQVTPNPVSQYGSYVVSGHLNKSTEFLCFTATSPSGVISNFLGWVNASGNIVDSGDVPLVVTWVSSEIGVYTLQVRMLSSGPKSIIASTQYTVQ